MRRCLRLLALVVPALAVVITIALVLLTVYDDTSSSATLPPAFPRDYRAELRAVAEAHQPPGANGWDIFEQAAALHEVIRVRHHDDAFALHNEGYVNYTLIWAPETLTEPYPLDEQIERIERQLADARDSGLLNLLARLAATDHLIPPPQDLPLLEITLPHLGQSRDFARLNAARMAHAARTGDQAEFVAAFEQNLWMARRVAASHPVLICRVVGVAVESLGLERVRDAAMAGHLAPEAAVAVLRMLDEHLPLLPTGATLDGERLMRLDSIDRLYTDDGNGDGLFVAKRADWLGGAGQGDPSALKAQDRGSRRFATKRQIHARDAELDGIMRRMIGVAPQDRAPIGDELEHELSRRAPQIPVGSSNLLLGLLYPAVGKALVTDDQHTLHLAATRIVLAIEVYRAQHGAAPPTLDALAPDILPALPLDPFTGEPLIYRPDPASPSGYTLYSAGFDRTDDGGIPHPESPHRALNSTGPGTDFLFVPPSR
ncbi:MAG: hypothetical protein KIS87_07010 [Phycisphaeraceae bacterium]|nr:hypothetical protein [Phycisphaeraceae bacterium]